MAFPVLNIFFLKTPSTDLTNAFCISPKVCSISDLKFVSNSLTSFKTYSNANSFSNLFIWSVYLSIQKPGFPHGTIIQTTRMTCKKNLVIRTTQLVGDLLLKILKYFKVVLNNFEFSQVKEIIES